jgi:hypothetical protein
MLLLVLGVAGPLKDTKEDCRELLENGRQRLMI